MGLDKNLKVCYNENRKVEVPYKTMTNKITIIEVYRRVMRQANSWRERAELHKEKYEKTQNENDLEEADIEENYAQDFYLCAKWLEETQEINPTK